MVYSTILRRFVAVFCEEDCIIEKSELAVSLGGKEDYSLKGSIITAQGWTKFDGADKKDKMLPNLNVGDKINVDFHPEQKQTQPPKHYTIETLNNYLKNPFKEDKASSDENDEEDYKAIFKGLELGTEATRTGIIDNAKKSGYISLKKDVYHIENGGRYLIEQLVDMNISMDKYKTSQLGQALKKVYRGEMTINESVLIAQKEIAEVFKNDPNDGTGFFGDKIGECPICGQDVVRGVYSYGCSAYSKGCKFKINFKILGSLMPKRQAEKLLATGFTEKMKFTSKSGKEFESKLKLEVGGQVVFDFDRK